MLKKVLTFIEVNVSTCEQAIIARIRAHEGLQSSILYSCDVDISNTAILFLIGVDLYAGHSVYVLCPIRRKTARRES